MREHPLPLGDIVPRAELKPEHQRPVAIPAIAIPVQEKSDFELPETHKDMLVKCIDATTDLIIVGWRGMERHFMNLWWAKTPPEYAPEGPPHLKRVLIVDKGEGAQVVEGQLRAEALMDFERISLELFSDGLSAFLRSDRLEAFLSQVTQGMPAI